MLPGGSMAMVGHGRPPTEYSRSTARLTGASSASHALHERTRTEPPVQSSPPAGGAGGGGGGGGGGARGPPVEARAGEARGVGRARPGGARGAHAVVRAWGEVR